jgi:hypothetical protein
MDVFEERKEIIQDVIDRLLIDPNYKQALIKFNENFKGSSGKNGTYRIINNNSILCQ